MIGTHNFWLDLGFLCLFAWTFLSLSYITGILILNIPSTDRFRKAFFNTLSGSLLIIDIYSCILTKCQTVNLCSLLIICYLAYQNKDFFNCKNLELKSLWPLLYIVPVTFILYGLYILPDSMQEDVKFYSKVVYNLSQRGVENIYHFYNDLEPRFNGLTPYHYTEFWFASFFRTSTNSLSIFSLKYFAYPFLIALLSFGIISITYRNHFLTFCLFICVSLLPLGHYLSFFNLGWQIINSFWLRPNLITYYLLFALLYNALLDKNIKLFYIFAGIGMTFSFVIAPPLFIGLLLVNLAYLLFRKISLKDVLKNMLIPFLCLVSILILFKLLGPPVNLTVAFSINELVMRSLHIWKAVIAVSIGLVAEALLIPLAFFAFNKKIKADKNENLLAFLIFFLVLIGVAMFQLLHSLDNAYQFAYFSYVGAGFLFIVLLVKSINLISNKIISRITILSACTLSLLLVQQKFAFSNTSKSLQSGSLSIENVSEDWTKNFKKYLLEHPGARGGYIFSSDNIAIYPSKARYCLTLQIGNYINFITDKNANLPCLNCRDSLLFDYKENNRAEFEKQLLWLNAFPKYTNECDPENYLLRGELDFFICHIDYPVKNKDLGILADPDKKLKMVYRK